MNQYFVYIMSNPSRTLYVGVTNDLIRRVGEHKDGEVAGFTKRYHTTRLVFFERCSEINAAIAREKQLKGWSRRKKIDLIDSMNPHWEDLSDRILATLPT